MKHVILLALACITLSGAFAQTFTHGVGFTIFSTQAQGASSQITGALTYSPRINFVEAESFSLSVGVPLSVGLSGSYNSNSYGTTDNSLSFLLNVPVLVNFNWGQGSTRDNESRFGFFAGAGFGYHYGSFNESEYDAYGNQYDSPSTVSSYGPAADAGIRFGVGRGSHDVEIRALYMKGLDQSKSTIIGGGAAFDF